MITWSSCLYCTRKVQKENCAKLGRPLVLHRITSIESCVQWIFYETGIYSTSVSVFFLRLLKITVLDQPTLDNGVVRRWRSVAVTVGCWLLAIGTLMALNGTSMALKQHFSGTSTTLQCHTKMPLKIMLVLFGLANVNNFFVYNIFVKYLMLIRMGGL